jgi:lipopolysaccharide/colanic/teichoic acid biosynthesis glycosyltransferase
MSVDEMPQLINVLKGEMSLVGPRPEMPFIVGRYDSVASRRLKVKPGITGLWQISPARAFPIHENLQYDLHYIRNQNLFLDCAIVARTITAVISGVGAV